MPMPIYAHAHANILIFHIIIIYDYLYFENLVYGSRGAYATGLPPDPKDRQLTKNVGVGVRGGAGWHDLSDLSIPGHCHCHWVIRGNILLRNRLILLRYNMYSIYYIICDHLLYNSRRISSNISKNFEIP